jgi:hypothetical protein
MVSDLRWLKGAARALLGLLVVALILGFLAWSLASNWSELRSEEIDLQPAYLVLGVLAGVAALVILSLGWTSLVRQLSAPGPVSTGRLVSAFFYSWVARYVPGKVAYVVTRFYLGRSLGYGAPVLWGSIAYENALQIVAGFGFAFLVIVPYVAREAGSALLLLLLLPLIAIVGALALQPRFLHRALSIGLSLIGREPVPADVLLRPRQIVRMLALYAAAFAVYGTGFYLLARSLTPYPVGYLPLAAGAFTIGGIMGMVTIIAPAGLGVREGVTVLVLQLTMPLETAALISLASRVWATVVDLVVIGGCLGYDYLRGDRMLLAVLRSRRADYPPGGGSADTLGETTSSSNPDGTLPPA